mmetsp:Transcript_28364/g.59127  ORF Transcript_28364/g.59127 Transcript_28364/m.59127 type:complete len:227 (+) Transcript_28364:1344-2024(+)
MEPQSIPPRPPRGRRKVRRGHLHGNRRLGRRGGHGRPALRGVEVQERREHRPRLPRRQGRPVDLAPKTEEVRGDARQRLRRNVGTRRPPSYGEGRVLRQVASQGGLLHHRVPQGECVRRPHPPTLQGGIAATFWKVEGRGGPTGLFPPPKALSLCGDQGARSSVSLGQAGHGQAIAFGVSSHLLVGRASLRRSPGGGQLGSTIGVVRSRPGIHSVQDAQVSRTGTT